MKIIITKRKIKKVLNYSGKIREVRNNHKIIKISSTKWKSGFFKKLIMYFFVSRDFTGNSVDDEQLFRNSQRYLHR